MWCEVDSQSHATKDEAIVLFYNEATFRFLHRKQSLISAAVVLAKRSENQLYDSPSLRSILNLRQFSQNAGV